MSRTLLLYLCLGLFAALPPAHSAPGDAPKQDPTLEDTHDKEAGKLRPIFNSLKLGALEADPTNQEHLDAVDWEARGVMYRLWWNRTKKDETLVEILTGKAGFDKTLEAMSKLADKNMGIKAELMAPVQRLFCKAVVNRGKDVIIRASTSTPKHALVSINAARGLYMITAREPVQSTASWARAVSARVSGETGEFMADALAELASNKSVNDGARYYVLRCLGDLLTLHALPAHLAHTTPATREKTKISISGKTLKKAVESALQLLDRKTDFPRNTPREELEGYKVLRWQALRVLAAASRVPEVDVKKPALYLARAAGGHIEIKPPPRLVERFEGAAGLAHLIGEGGKHPNLQADYAALQVARAVAEFGVQADFNIEAKAPRRLYAWKAEAAHLHEAVNRMAKNKSPYVAKAVEQCLVVLKKLEEGKSSDAADLANWVTGEEARPKSSSLFKDDPASTVVVDPAARTLPKDKGKKKEEKEPAKDKKKDKGEK